MLLSILICSIPERFSYMSSLIPMLQNQTENQPVEILWLGDNKQMTVGEKRNKLLKLAKGYYVSFIDDDDMISPDYVQEILNAAKTNPDVICFECLFNDLQKGIENHVYFGKQYLNENHTNDAIRKRMPNHLCPVKREIALQIKYPEKSFGEDSEYALKLRNSFLLKTEVCIPKTLYYYNFNATTSATWKYSYVKTGVSSTPPIKLDVVIVSDGTARDLRQMTQQCVHTYFNPQSNIVVMEKNEKISYTHAETIVQPLPFNYNRCLNEGALYGNAEFICFSNNDVGVPLNFLSKAIDEMNARKLDVAGVKDQRGYAPTNCITGWCFIIRRDAWLKIGMLNEDYTFYCADNIVWEQIHENNLTYNVLQHVYCHHGISVTKNRLDAETKKEYTEKCVNKFNREHKSKIPC